MQDVFVVKASLGDFTGTVSWRKILSSHKLSEEGDQFSAEE